MKKSPTGLMSVGDFYIYNTCTHQAECNNRIIRKHQLRRALLGMQGKRHVQIL